jgi:parvulin-like peptidyl-prolyl isomerase
VGDGTNLPAQFDQAGRAAVTAVFGEDFGRAVERLGPGPEWQGPIRGKEGWHLVRLAKRETAPLPPLDRVRGAVETDWRKASAEARATAAYEALRSNYTVHIER